VWQFTQEGAHPVSMPGWFGRIVAGAAGGLVGGVLFGILMQLTDTIQVVAGLVDQESVAVGWAVHMSIAVLVGVTYTLLFGLFSEGLLISTVLGSFYGIIWWVLGGLTLLPLRLGLGLFTFDTTAWQSLAGHIAYGLALGVVYAVMAHLLVGRGQRAQPEPPPLPVFPESVFPEPAYRPDTGAVQVPPGFPPAFPPPAPGPRSGVAPLPPAARALRQRGRPSQHS
jgi:hypothetical protein